MNQKQKRRRRYGWYGRALSVSLLGLVFTACQEHPLQEEDNVAAPSFAVAPDPTFTAEQQLELVRTLAEHYVAADPVPRLTAKVWLNQIEMPWFCCAKASRAR